LFAWKEDLQHECILLLDNVYSQSNVIDKCSCKIELNDKYTVK